MPRRWFDPKKFPYKTYAWENNGKIYEKLRIRKWKDKVPDMSKVYKKMVPKKFDIASNADTLAMLVKETCVAEFVHKLLMLLGFGCKLIWEGIGGSVVSILWILGNLPFVFIQRYNRPKLLNTYLRLREYEQSGRKWLKTR